MQKKREGKKLILRRCRVQKGSSPFRLRWAPPPQRLLSDLRPSSFHGGFQLPEYFKGKEQLSSTSNTAEDQATKVEAIASPSNGNLDKHPYSFTG